MNDDGLANAIRGRDGELDAWLEARGEKEVRNAMSALMMPDMTLRDYFAAASLAGTRPGKAYSDGEIELIAKGCYRMADAMLAERDKK